MAQGKKETTVQIAQRLAQPVIDELGLILWDVVFEKEGSGWYLRYLLDKDGGIDIQDCENFSRKIDPILDEVDPIAQSYTLEVSSPGVQRLLTQTWHFETCHEQQVEVRLIRPVDGIRDFMGVLAGYHDGEVILLLENDVKMTFHRSEAAYIRLYYDFAKEDHTDEGEKVK